jgi:hypothetical protein
MSAVLDLQTIATIIGSLGIGGILSLYFQHIWNKNKEIESQKRSMKEDRFRTCLVYMRCFLDPTMKNVYIVKIPEEIKTENGLKEFSRKQIIAFRDNAILFASDQVIGKLNEFIKNPNETLLLETAQIMNVDLWDKNKFIHP